METKTCTKCGVEKPIEQFYFFKNKYSETVKNGKVYRYEGKRSYRYGYCNTCRCRQNHNWYKKWKFSIKKKIVEHYTKGQMACQCCGEKGLIFLTIDHKNGDGSKHKALFGGKTYFSRSGQQKPIQDQLKFYRWIIKNNFPEDLQILCYNCNCGKRQSDKCPHELMKMGLSEEEILTRKQKRSL